MSMIIDVKEDRDVATADMVGAYLFVDMKDTVIMNWRASRNTV